jgi:putative polyhydroxyalkanoate system protein
MPDIHLKREHTLGLDAARKVASDWADQLRDEFGMDCRLDSGVSTDILHFSRSGASGTLEFSASVFELDAHLGFLLGAYKDRIEAEVSSKLDQLLSAAALAN